MTEEYSHTWISMLCTRPAGTQIPTTGNLIWKYKLEEYLKIIRDTNATEVNLYRHELSKLPQLPKEVEKLNLCGNKFSTFPDLSQYKNLKQLNISYNNIKKLPPNLGDLGLTHLDITGNSNLKDISVIGELKQLQYLRMDHLEIDKLPTNLSNLKELRFLSCCCNDLENVDVVTQFLKLNGLHIAFNKIEVIPENIGDLKDLKDLHLAGNQIKTIPSSFINLTKIKVMNWGDNPIDPIPKWVREMKSLLKCYPKPEADEELSKPEGEEETTWNTGPVNPIQVRERENSMKGFQNPRKTRKQLLKMLQNHKKINKGHP